MEIVKNDQTAVDKAVKILSEGGLVIYPTETIYGVGADATNKDAILKLTQFKKRPFGKPYSIAVADMQMAQKYVSLNESAKNFYREFLPGPVTVVSSGKHKVAEGVESELGTLGIRIPDFPLVTEIVKKLGKPITATSANASYQKRPYKISDILENISGKQKNLIDLIIDAGTLPPKEPSTVIDTTLDDPIILRQGDIKIGQDNNLYSRSEENTQNIAKELWQKYEKFSGKRPIIFALQGPMGAGKTQFTKGLAKAMGINEKVVSPTFNLLLEYGKRLTHIDAWRMQSNEDLDGLGVRNILENKNSVIAIEWAERVLTSIKGYSDDATIVWVNIKYGKGDNDRLIEWGNI